MPILYSVVARGKTLLTEFASCPGNYSEVTEQVLEKIPPENAKLTYSNGSYLFHYICEDRIIYMCIADDEFERSRAFLYLNEIKRRFVSTYGVIAQTEIAYSMSTEFSRILANEMKHYSESQDNAAMSQVQDELDKIKDILENAIYSDDMQRERLQLLVNQAENLVANKHSSESQDIDTVPRVHAVIDEIKDLLIKNNDNLFMQGERLQLLVNQVDNLSVNAVTFQKTSRNISRAPFWKNVKIYVIIAIVALVIIYFIVSISCGGLTWSNCVG